MMPGYAPPAFHGSPSGNTKTANRRSHDKAIRVQVPPARSVSQDDGSHRHLIRVMLRMVGATGIEPVALPCEGECSPFQATRPKGPALKCWRRYVSSDARSARLRWCRPGARQFCCCGCPRIRHRCSGAKLKPLVEGAEAPLFAGWARCLAALPAPAGCSAVVASRHAVAWAVRGAVLPSSLGDHRSGSKRGGAPVEPISSVPRMSSGGISFTGTVAGR